MAKLAGWPEATFAALERVRETALIRYNSLFAPERNLWGLEDLRQFHTLFVGRFDKGEGSFLEKWRKQLEGANDNILQLAAELLYVQQFFTTLTGPEKKLENVRVVLSWCVHPATIPEWAIEGMQRGFAGDQSFNQHRPFHLFNCCAAFGCCLDIVVVGIHPGLNAQNLVVRDIVGKEDKLFQGEIRHDKPALKGLNICPVVSARVGPDRGYFEFRARHWLSRLTKSDGVRSGGN